MSGLGWSARARPSYGGGATFGTMVTWSGRTPVSTMLSLCPEVVAQLSWAGTRSPSHTSRSVVAYATIPEAQPRRGNPQGPHPHTIRATRHKRRQRANRTVPTVRGCIAPCVSCPTCCYMTPRLCNERLVCRPLPKSVSVTLGVLGLTLCMLICIFEGGALPCASCRQLPL